MSRCWTPGLAVRVGQWICNCGRANNPAHRHCKHCDEPRPAAAPTIGRWRCPSCESSNNDARHKCWYCSTPKPASAKVTGATGRTNVFDRWMCPRCRVLRPVSSVRCPRCLARRPNP